MAYHAVGKGEVPPWVLLLEAAGYDPLRAAEIEENLSLEWWQRWLLEREQRIKAQNRAMKHG